VGDNAAIAIAAAVGLQALISIFALVRWSFSRNLQSEDHAKLEMRKKLETHDAKFEKLQSELGELKSSLGSLVTALPELKGALQEMARSFETTRDKQAQFYRQELEKLEQLLRQDMTRVVSPDLTMRVQRVEREVEALKAKKRR
jgi:chromosome segregation ATPase